MAEDIDWRDHEGNIWHTAGVAAVAGELEHVTTLLQAADPENVPAEPVFAPTGSLEPVTPLPLMPDDVGVKSQISEKGTTGIKSGQLYWRDDAGNIWLAETYTDHTGHSWTDQALSYARDMGNPPKQPVVNV